MDVPHAEGSFFVRARPGHDVHCMVLRTVSPDTWTGSAEGGTGTLYQGSKKWGNPKFYMEVPNMRVKITLACSECKQRNYDTKKNKKNDPDRLELNKYCRFCRKHTLHRETK